jgi:hypothetical protein
MEKVYLKFGAIDEGTKFITVFEGILDELNIIKLLLPRTSYSSCQSIAQVLDLPVFLVVGDVKSQSTNGQPVLANYRIKSKLKYNASLENYTFVEKRKKTPAKKRPPWRFSDIFKTESKEIFNINVKWDK